MIIGESEKILGNFMGVCLFWGVASWIFIRLFYTWVFLICLYFIIWSFGSTISCCWESVVYNFLFWDLYCRLIFVSYKHCMQIVRRNLGGFFLGGGPRGPEL